MKSAISFSLSLLVFVSSGLSANINIINKYVPEADQVGEVRFKYLWLDIYDVALYSPEGVFTRDDSFALKIVYLRDFEGEKIAERSVKEIKGQGYDNKQKLRKWENTMKEIFPDVSKGDAIIGIRDKQGVSRFYYNGEDLGEVTDTEFSKHFFDIWLGENSSSAEYTQRLLGN